MTVSGQASVPIGRTPSARPAAQAAAPAPPLCLAKLRTRLGLAAGYDRDGSQLAACAAAGFGFIEIGTITGGVEDMGAVAGRIAAFRHHQPGVRVGVSIGSLEDGYGPAVLEDFAAGLCRFAPAADYLALNLSGRRHPVRREYGAEAAARFLAELGELGRGVATRLGRDVPLVPKLVLNRTWRCLVPILTGGGFAAVSAVVEGDLADLEAAITALAPLPVIAVGGIRAASDAGSRFACGAALVQIHRAFADGGAAAVATIAAGCPG